MDSKLLSGGLENRFVTSFSPETKQKISEILLVSQDHGLNELLNVSKPTLTEEDKVFNDVMTEGNN